ncbi:MAG TPA: PD-(D/E)XK nuclease family protein [Bryobacteraceae bacterium]|nr:PD-(D/E)XK nuclease family protein [Bryobacteraceae bacterium]
MITGPAGSGKTALVLEEFRQALRRNRERIRLLVPTATMARHLENEVAREGLVLRRNLIQTLSGFVEERGGEPPQAPDAMVYLTVEQVARRQDQPEFHKVAQTPGFCASLARTIAEFSAAGCDSARLAAALPEAPLAAAFWAIYEEVDAVLKARGLALRGQRLEAAARRIRREGLAGIEDVWMDGFQALPDPELAVIEAIAKHASVTLTLGNHEASRPLRDRLAAMGFQEERRERSRPSPAHQLVRARSIEREVEEIARRIVEQATAGRLFREMGIIVRTEDPYVALLRSTLERFGIPARFYFDLELQRQPAIRFLTGAVDAMLSGWEHAATLAALQLAPRFVDSRTMDRFSFAVRDKLPDRGLENLKALLPTGGERLLPLIDALAKLEEWRPLELAPEDWAARLGSLRELYRPARPEEGADHERALEWRVQAAALDLYEESLREAAQALQAGCAIRLPEFWRTVKSVLRLKPLRVEDARRDVVHVLSAHEARQWVLPIVFICGMVEKQFPRFHPQDPFFSEAARGALNAAGIRVRTAGEFESEEQALFETALSRATMLVTLSYPELNPRGDRNLPSIFLEDLLLIPEEAKLVRPRPRHTVAAPEPPVIREPRLLAALREKTARVAPTSLESYLQCPFQYFARKTLRLEAAPLRPEERLDFRMQGTIVHEVLAEWYPRGGDILPFFERIFQRYLTENHIPWGYHTERLRNAMEEDLARFAADGSWPREKFQSRVEQKFEFALDDSLSIPGRIDRIDTAPGGPAYVIDYKYSGAQRVKNRLESETQLQAPLYLIAAEKALGIRLAGVFFAGIKGGVAYAGWSEPPFLESVPIPENWREITTERALEIVDQIRQGRVAPSPADPDGCRFCDTRDVCRYEARRAAAAPENA